MHILLSSGWDDNINGGKLCLFNKPGEKIGGTIGDTCGDTLVVFDSYIECGLMPTFADR